MKYKTWKTLSKEKVYKTPIFDIVLANKEESTGKKRNYIQLDAPNWVTMIPIFTNKDGVKCFLMAKQFRQGEEKVTLEFIAGTVEKDEDITKAAKREFREETGYTDGNFKLINTVNPNSAFMTNKQYIYLVTDFKTLDKQDLDEDESIEIVEIPVNTVLENMGKNEYSNGTMCIAMLAFLQEENLIKLF